MAKRTRSDAADLLKAISKQPAEGVEKPTDEIIEEKEGTPPKPTSKPKKTSFGSLEKRPKEQLNTTVDPDVKRAISLIQADVQRVGAKKPKIGEVIETAIMGLLESRGLSLD